MDTSIQNCKNCGAPLAEDATFCENCGSRVAAPTARPNAEVPKASSPTILEVPPEPVTRKRSKWIMIGGLALVAVVILAGIYIWKNQNDPIAWRNKGYEFYSQGKYDEALKAYEEAIRLDPKYYGAWSNKGAAFLKQGKYDEAIKAFDEAIRLIDPKSFDYHADSWNGKGKALYSLGKYDEAIKAFDEAIRLDPNYEDYWSNKGDAFLKQGKYDEAIKAFDEAIRVNPIEPKNAVFWHNKGLALHGLNRNAEADAAYAKAKKLGYNGP